MNRRLNILRFTTEELSTNLQLPFGVNVIDARLDFATQMIEVVVEGDACTDTPEGNRITVSSVDRLWKGHRS